jgi:hypothetical protein
MALTRSYDNARVDAACRRGILIKAHSSTRQPATNPCATRNIRGQSFFTEPWRYQC